MNERESGHGGTRFRFGRGFGLPAVVERELRMAARRSSTYWTRVGVGLVAGTILGWWLIGPVGLGLSPQVGQGTFRFLTLAAALMVLGSLIPMTAEFFAREKREGTLGLLLLTPLKPRDIVLGKLVSSGLGSFYRFVALVPWLAIPLLVGGVALRDFLLLVLALANLTFFTAAMGLYFSADSWEEKRAASLTKFALIGFLGAAPLLGLWLGPARARGQGMPFLYSMNPAYGVWRAALTGAPSGWFWWSLFLTHACGWWFFIATCRILPNCWQEKQKAILASDATPLAGVEERSDFRTDPVFSLWAPVRVAGAATMGRSAVRQEFTAARSSSLLKVDPMVWFALRWKVRTGGACALVLCVAGLFGVFLIIFSFNDFSGLLAPQVAVLISYVVNVGLKTDVATQAGLAFARDRVENPLELLLATPVTPDELVRGNFVALRGSLRSFVRAALLGEAVWLVLALLFNPLRNPPRELLVYTAIGLAGLLLLVPDLYAVGWSALRAGAIATDSRTAASNAQLKVLFLPWLSLAILAPIAAIKGWGLNPWVLLGILTIGSVLADWRALSVSRRRLIQELPHEALRRACGEVGYYKAWEVVGRWLGQCWRSMR